VDSALRHKEVTTISVDVILIERYKVLSLGAESRFLLPRPLHGSRRNLTHVASLLEENLMLTSLSLFVVGVAYVLEQVRDDP
jgi:hypothetical protein